MNKFDTLQDKILLVFFYIFITITALITLYPFWSIVILSISPKSEVYMEGFRLITLNPDFSSYRHVLSSSQIGMGFVNTVFRTVAGTVISLIFMSLMAYPLSKKDFPLNKLFTMMLVFTMIFHAGLIPNYLLIKSLGMVNTWWALILPGAVSAYELIIMRNFMKAIPDEMEESAKIDGASDFTIWWRIIMPLCKSVLATVALWNAVQNWNAYLDALIYITDKSKTVLQVVLRRILMENRSAEVISETVSNFQDRPTEETVKAAVIMVSTLPIVMVYPFIQKYFVKGIMLGSVKG